VKAHPFLQLVARRVTYRVIYRIDGEHHRDRCRCRPSSRRLPIRVKGQRPLLTRAGLHATSDRAAER
jgi:hypothetical protein